MSEFDPSTALLNYTSAYGETQITFLDLQEYLSENIQVSVIYGCRIGCAGLMSIVLWAISRNRRTPIFILNQFSLLFLVIHSVLYVCYLFGSYNSVAANFTGYDLSTAAAKRITIATDIIQVVLILCIEASLVFQVKIIFRSPEVYRLGLLLTTVSAATGLAAFGCYLAACIKSIVSLDNGEPLGVLLSNLPVILFAVSTIFICIILMAKLALAIRSRRYLGLKQFGTLHILVIMTTQTMVIPTVLVILSFGYITTIYTRLTPIAIMLVTLQLPFSSMWAASANNSSEPSSTAGSYISKTSSRTSMPTLLTSNSSTLYGDVNSPDIESHSQKFRSPTETEYALLPPHREKSSLPNTAVTAATTGIDSYELDDEDKAIWAEANRLTKMYIDEENDEGSDSEEFVSKVVHTINYNPSG